MQRNKVCPYYKDGYCVSPVHETPTNVVVSPQRCFNTYKTCRFYVEKGDKEEKQGLEIYSKEEVEQEVKFYPKVNILDGRMDSGCQFFQLIRTNFGFVAYCGVLRRVLTRGSAMLCSKSWQTCPLAAISSPNSY